MKCEDFQKTDVIDNYIQGKLSEKEREEFARHYFECDRCFEELKFRESLVRVCRKHGEALFAEFSDARAADRKEALGKVPNRIFPGPLWRIRWAYAVAPLVVILILMALFVNVFSPNRYKNLADVKPYPYLLAGLRSGASDQERLFHEGMRFYTDGEYDEASRLLEQCIATDSEDVLAQFFLGVSLLLDGKPAKAIQNLGEVSIAEPDSEIFHWYLGQAYLKKGLGEEAREEFVKVRDLDGNYRSNAEALIRRIDEMED